MTTSTINPAIPAANSAVASAPVRGNFQAAYNDVNALWAAIAAGVGVSSVNTLTGAVVLAAGTNVTLVPSGNTITINAAGSPSGVSSLNSLTGILSIAAGSGITVTPSGDTITIAATGSGGGVLRSINSVSTDTSAAADASTDYVYLCSGTMTLTLPTAIGNSNLYTIKNVDTATVTIATTSAQTLDGGATLVLASRYQSYQLISDNANWNIVG